VALEADDLRTILPALGELHPRNRLLMLGNANVLVASDALRALAAEAQYELAPWQGALDVFALGGALGFATTETLDVAGEPSIVHDLHVPVPGNLREKYDCVVDAGVLFWCADPAAALKNVFRLVRARGLIAHSVAVSGYYGRGYYSVHPRLLEDFYLLNGCTFVAATYRPRSSAGRRRSRLAARFFPSIRPRLSWNDAPGGVYLVSSDATRVVFGRRGHDFHDPPTMPTNVQGMLVFRKGRSTDPELPVLTEKVVAADVP
jgi:SAM-dependent methyltransferase